jgi:hypothetical protein
VWWQGGCGVEEVYNIAAHELVGFVALGSCIDHLCMQEVVL